MLYTASNAHLCPNAANHTPQPSNYIAWDEDCERREARGEVQTQCPACGLWAIWKPAPKKREGVISSPSEVMITAGEE